MAKIRLTYDTPEVQAILDSVQFKQDKVEGKGLTTNDFTDAYKAKLEALGIHSGTTAYWDSVSYTPAAGELVIYTDYQSKEVDGKTVYIPGIKVGSGNGYVQDLAFISEAQSAALIAHIQDLTIHVTSSEKAFWNDKQDTITDLADIRAGAALGATALQSFTEADPTVPAWAKASTKPTYTAAEVGALPSTTLIPTKTSDLINDSGFIHLGTTLETL